MEEKFNWSPIVPDNIKWVGIDWDDCLVNNSGYPDFIPTTPTQGAIDVLNRLDSNGYKIIIYTARPWSDYHNIEKYCEHYKIPARRIICGKPLFKYIIDDKNIEFKGNWDEVIKKIC